ncbi:hypothetical protein [Ancylobacter lacus]|uniref:hypothetical protein n=1 Tax=Ancylobacter lacus TaxID=2579970 RepID=UPI001BCE185C|nr:hypothetical protein [Ancylobacter lacus]MBS7537759.1 hypothetical protein [Ancylobacter lacus]
MEIPDVPANEDPEFKAALSALVNSAMVMRRLFLMAAVGSDPERLARKHADLIMNADGVIDAWRDHLGIEEID